MNNPLKKCGCMSASAFEQLFNHIHQCGAEEPVTVLPDPEPVIVLPKPEPEPVVVVQPVAPELPEEEP